MTILPRNVRENNLAFPNRYGGAYPLACRRCGPARCLCNLPWPGAKHKNPKRYTYPV